MVEVSYWWLCAVVGATLLAALICAKLMRGAAERLFAVTTLAGLWFYCGLGASYRPVLPDYAVCYCLFIILFAVTLSFTVKSFRKAGMSPGAYQAIEKLSQNRIFLRVAIVTYLSVSFLPLVYPSLRLQQLWAPPAPDLSATFNNGLRITSPLLLRVAGYMGHVIWPFYLLALYSCRRRYVQLALYITLPLYFRYCASGYVGRYEILMCLLLYGALLWLDRPRFRIPLIILTLSAAPFLLLFFEAYLHLRLKEANTNQQDASQRIETLIVMETSFPRLWTLVTANDNRADMAKYVTWLLTLPIPKVLTGEIAGARLNHDLNELMFGVTPGTVGYSVTLTGPITESVYIYGRPLFWLHAIFVGVLAGACCGLAAGSRCLQAVLVQFALTFGLVFGRAGVAGALPILVNSYLALYILMIFASGHSERHMRRPLRTIGGVRLAGVR